MSIKSVHNTSISSQKSTKSNKSNKTIFNEEVINNNQKKCKFLSKIVNKVVKVTSKKHTLTSLKKCAERNFKNMNERIEKCNLNSSAATMSSKSRLSCSSFDSNSHRKRKTSLSSSRSSSKRRNFTASLNGKVNLSNSDEKINKKNKKNQGSESDNDSESEDEKDKRSKLIQELVDEQKARLSIIKHDSDSSDSEKLNKREIKGKFTLSQIKKLRRLPDYDKINKILNEPKKSHYRKSNTCSLNTLPLKKYERTDHWDTYTFLSKKVEQCVLTRQWSNLTNLLILLAKAPQKYQRDFFLKTTLINIICNPASKHDESMIEGFLKSCYSCQSDFDMEKVLSDLFHLKEKPEHDEDNEEETSNEVSADDIFLTKICGCQASYHSIFYNYCHHCVLSMNFYQKSVCKTTPGNFKNMPCCNLHKQKAKPRIGYNGLLVQLSENDIFLTMICGCQASYRGHSYTQMFVENVSRIFVKFEFGLSELLY